jgi:hypothetical protein
MPRYAWDAQAGRYRDSRGAFVPHLRGRFDALVDAESARVSGLLRGVADGTSSPAEFALQLRDSVKFLETSATMLARGGKAHATASDWASAGGRIGAQFAYTPRFISEMEAGLESDPAFVADRLTAYLARADRYLTSAVGSFENLTRDALDGDGLEEKRALDRGGKSCPSCVRYAAAGWGPVGHVPGIGQACECGGSCRCRFVRRRVVKRKQTFSDDLTFNDIRELLSAAVNDGVAPTDYGRRYWVRDVADSWVVFEDNTDSALYRRTYVIGEDQAVTLGDVERVAVRTKYDKVQMAAFSIEAGAEAGSVVTWSGPIFRAGDYPDKGFAASADDLAAAADAFEPVDLNVEHKDSIFSGAFGELRRIWAEGEELHGEIVTPSWFRDDVVKGSKLSVSTEWDMEAKRLVGLATALSPRVTGAELVAAFSKGEAHFVGRRNSKTDAGRIQAIHDHTAELGAACGATPKEKKTMSESTTQSKPSFLDKVKALFGSATPEELATLTSASAPAPVAPPVTPSAPATLSSDADEITRLRAENEQLKTVRQTAIASQAAAFADGEIAAGRRVPADRDELVAIFTDAATLDDTSPRTVTFSVGGQAKTGTRVDELRAREAARSSHGLLNRTVGAGGTVAMSGSGATPPDDIAAAVQAAESYAATKNAGSHLKAV